MLFNRFSLLEFFAFWRDGITAGELAHVFGLTREQTQKNIVSPFQREFGGHAHYDRRARRIALDDDAEGLKLSPSNVVDAVNFFSAAQAFARAEGRDSPPIPGWVPIEDLLQPVDNVQEAGHFRLLYSAAARHRSVHLSYAAKSGHQEMTFSPHALVRTTSRPHFRGYAKYSLSDAGHYIDVIPGRVADAQPGTKIEYIGAHDDVDWHRRVTVEATLNPDLSKRVATSLRLEFGFADRLRIKQIRAATAPYICDWLENRHLYGVSTSLWKDTAIIDEDE